MSEERFNEPRLGINRVYTRRGDQGETGLVGGQRVPKDSPRIAAYGTVDELNAFVGAARVTALEAGLAELAAILLRIQHELFNLGSILATLPEDVHPRQPRVTDREIDLLEKEMDRMNQDLHPLRSFVLPGASRLDADLHIARTVCRRAERVCLGVENVPPEAIRYLNRLSDAFFVYGRWAAHVQGQPEILWSPNEG